jgi:hypothetical protein
MHATPFAKVKLGLAVNQLSSTQWINMGSGGVFPPFVLGSRWRRMTNFKLRRLYLQGNGLRYLLDWRMDGPQSRLDAAKRQICSW